ncbi:hypothetical protein Ahy_B08g090500 isoform A [Arachis hypogaea]|uniref:Uncharacterized protein n=1 Tax=Arachis hypogaea TaxID=3818 RepID=A0A444Y073_ARAHY|nr:hypothetical protein Ahy_B08g090500 isoform A [Arachis hypogaea]
MLVIHQKPHKLLTKLGITIIIACEVVWRLFGYEIQEKEPFVITLPLYLEDEQFMVYSETFNINDIVKRAISHKSVLTYDEFPTKCVWKDDALKWFPQKQDFAIGRLTHVPAVRGTIHATYRDACFALGLLQDDREFMDAIKEASLWASRSYVRRLFVILLTSNNISSLEHVWDKILHSYDKILKDYPPMPLATKFNISLSTERGISEELKFNRDELKKGFRHVGRYNT